MLPQLNRLIEASFVRDESSASNADATAVPSQHRVTQQILNHWQSFLFFVVIYCHSKVFMVQSTRLFNPIRWEKLNDEYRSGLSCFVSPAGS